MTTQTKTETPDNGQSELEGLAEDTITNIAFECFLSDETFKPSLLKPFILTALTTATAPLKAEIAALTKMRTKPCKRCNGIGRLYHFPPKGYTAGGHYYDCTQCGGTGRGPVVESELKQQLAAAHAKIRELEQHLSGK